MLVSKFMPKNERKQFLSKNQEQQNNFQQNMPQPPYQMLYTIPPRPMPNRFYKNNNYNYNYRRPKYPHQQQMANKASFILEEICSGLVVISKISLIFPIPNIIPVIFEIASTSRFLLWAIGCCSIFLKRNSPR